MGLTEPESANLSKPTQGTLPGQPEAFAFSDKILLVSQPGSVAAELLRALRGVLLAQHVQAGRRSLAICGASAGVGCSFMAANLAVGMSQVGVNTLLIDANLRDPAIDKYISGGDREGALVDLLRDDALSYGHAIRPVQTNLSVLFAGEADSADVEQLGGTAFQRLIKGCIREYDLTIVDTPPANRYADCRRIASVVRYALAVTCRRQSYVSDLHELVAQLQLERTKVIGSYMNDY